MKGMVLIAALFLGGSTLRAEFMDLNLWGGYTTVSMAKVNETLDMTAANINQSSGGVLQFSDRKLHDAYVAGLDALYKAGPALAGVRVEYIGLSSGGLWGGGSVGGQHVDLNGTYDASLIPVMVGITGRHGKADGPMHVDFSLYGGVGFANVKQTVVVDSNVPSVQSGTSTAYIGGSCFVGEFNVTLRYKLNMFLLGADVGYRLANVPEANYTQDTTMMSDSHKKGEAVKDPEDRVINLDYSGVIAGLSVGMEF